MKKWIVLMMALLLCMGTCSVLADAVPMEKYQPGQMIDVGFNGDVTFMAGCELDGGTSFMLVDTDFFDGYLLVDSPLYSYDSISGGIPIPDTGWSAEVTAADSANCTVKLKKGVETRKYHFAYEFTEQGQSEWVLKHYGRENTKGDYFHADLSFFRADVSESIGGKVENAIIDYDFFRQANNINYQKHPFTLEECLALEKAHPVAAVSPKDPATRVNLRKGPGTNFPRCGSLYSGALLSVREISDGWAKIYVGDTDAYISAEFLTFGAEIENVPDMRPLATVRDGDWIKVSRVPYWGGGGSVTQTRGGQEVRIMGEYNKEWRIVSANPGSYYIHVDDLK